MSQTMSDNGSRESERRRRAEERRLRRESAERRIAESQRLPEIEQERIQTQQDEFRRLAEESRRERREIASKRLARFKSLLSDDGSPERQSSNGNRISIEHQTRPINELREERRELETSRPVGSGENNIGIEYEPARDSDEDENGLASRVIIEFFEYSDEPNDPHEAKKFFSHLTIFFHVNFWFCDRYFWTDKNTEPPFIVVFFYFLTLVSWILMGFAQNPREPLRSLNEKVFRFRMSCRQYCPSVILENLSLVIFIYSYILINIGLVYYLDLAIKTIKFIANVCMDSYE